MSKKDSKNKNKNNSKINNESKKISGYKTYLSPEMVNCDVDGSYTGIPADMFYDGVLDEQPVQDADDL